MCDCLEIMKASVFCKKKKMAW